jgi:hypothetical protein
MRVKINQSIGSLTKTIRTSESIVIVMQKNFGALADWLGCIQITLHKWSNGCAALPCEPEQRCCWLWRLLPAAVLRRRLAILALSTPRQGQGLKPKAKSEPLGTFVYGPIVW